MKKQTILPLLILLLSLSFLHADEGMWLFDIAPKEQIKEKYGFELTDQWLEHVQKSTARFARSGTASFVSSQGLILTNHHVGSRTIHSLSTPENDLLENGFYAKTFADELKCPGLEILVTMLSEDVTDKVNVGIDNESRERSNAQRPDQPAEQSGRSATLRSRLSPEEAQKIRNANIAAIEKEYADRTGLRCEVTTLFQGGKYYMYGYKVYNDIRLVWAPENGIGSFGGDPDNYEYPRYCVDATFFRAYENGVPAKIEHYLKWNFDSIKDGELLFVSGFPGSTQRALTREHLEFQRDVFFPWRLQKLFRREVILSAFGAKSVENQRRIANELTGVQNYRKRAMGQLQGLQTPALWGENIPTAVDEDENTLEARIKKAFSWAKVRYRGYDLFEGAEAFNSRVFQWARTLVRLAEESEKPNDERLREYREGNLESLKASLLADTPVYKDVELLKLTDSLSMMYEDDGSRHWHLFEINALGAQELARRTWSRWQSGFKSPKEWATELLGGTKLFDVAERKRLLEGGSKAVKASNDPMILFASRIDKLARDKRSEYEANVDAPLASAYAELAQRRFAELGTKVYPDATFTLRLSYGKVKGYTDDTGTEIAPFTHIAGMFDRAEQQRFREPFDLPKSWKDAKDKLDLSVPFNFVTTNDIVGGNSGSPVINTRGEVVGCAFDGNIYSLSNNFVYTETQSRCVSVHVAVIVESLKKIYGAQRLLDELGR